MLYYYTAEYEGAATLFFTSPAITASEDTYTRAFGSDVSKGCQMLDGGCGNGWTLIFTPKELLPDSQPFRKLHGLCSVCPLTCSITMTL
jgi:hypothetical protein